MGKKKHPANARDFGEPNKQIVYASVLPYTLILYLVKAAIVTWYYTITPRTLPRCRLALHLISAVCLASFCLAVGSNCFSCYPVHHNWALDPVRLCIASARPWAFFVSFGCHLATEILIFVYPFPLLRSIRTAHPHPRRWGIFFLFALGFLAIVATCARVIAITVRYCPTCAYVMMYADFVDWFAVAAQPHQSSPSGPLPNAPPTSLLPAAPPCAC